jgi:hypothetical protein
VTDYRTMIREIQEAHRALGQLEGIPPAGAVGPSVRDGCPEEGVAAAEGRLGVRFPPSYRSFLLQVDGCDRLGLSYGGLLRAEQVRWFREDNLDWITAYSRADLPDISEEEHRVSGPEQDPARFRHAYLPHLLQIGDVYDSAVYLLNPLVRDGSGEWEAWCFSDSHPGAYREPSFLALIEEARDGMLSAVRLRSLPVDEDRVLAEALPALRRSIEEDGLLPAKAVMTYIMERYDSDGEFAAWCRRTQPYYALLRALGYER